MERLESYRDWRAWRRWVKCDEVTSTGCGRGGGGGGKSTHWIMMIDYTSKSVMRTVLNILFITIYTIFDYVCNTLIINLIYRHRPGCGKVRTFKFINLRLPRFLPDILASRIGSWPPVLPHHVENHRIFSCYSRPLVCQRQKSDVSKNNMSGFSCTMTTDFHWQNVCCVQYWTYRCLLSIDGRFDTAHSAFFCQCNLLSGGCEHPP